MEAEKTTQFVKRSKSGRPRKRIRELTNEVAEEAAEASATVSKGEASNLSQESAGTQAEIRRSKRNVLLPEGTSAVRTRPMWRDEYDHNSNKSAEEADDRLATASRPLIDEADKPAHSSQKKMFESKNSQYGPLRAPTHIRASVHVDYQPDVCKDYKETGYCGFGDACKFLHDRSDYKAGWKLERDWIDKQGHQNKDWGSISSGTAAVSPQSQADVHAAAIDGLPFACFLCRKPFVAPVVTLCNHYFCEKCALTRMAKDPTCAVCSKNLRGVLNTAAKLMAKIQAASQ